MIDTRTIDEKVMEAANWVLVLMVLSTAIESLILSLT